MRSSGGKALDQFCWGALGSVDAEGNQVRSPAHLREAPPDCTGHPCLSRAAAFPAFVLREACESGLYANWVMIQESSGAEGGNLLHFPPGLQEPLMLLGRGSPGTQRCGRGGTQWGRLTAWSSDLDGLTAGHGLGARLTHTFLPAEGHLVSNGERLPARGTREKFNASSLEGFCVYC